MAQLQKQNQNQNILPEKKFHCQDLAVYQSQASPRILAAEFSYVERSRTEKSAIPPLRTRTD